MRNAILCAALILAGCSNTPQPVSQAQLQADLTTAIASLKVAGCITAELATLAAPIVAVAADPQGNKVLTIVGQSGAMVCSIPAPAGVASAPGTTLGAVVAQ